MSKFMGAIWTPFSFKSTGEATGANPVLPVVSAQCGVSEITIHSRQWILGGVQARGASARAPEHIPKWICKERATTPPPKRHAALRVALKWAWGVVAQSVEYRWGYTPSLAPRPKPISAQRMYSYFGDTTPGMPSLSACHNVVARSGAHSPQN